ncbi:MAG: hypothetical protein Q4E06_06060 [Lautropia sp.]|nr:hypothetical protein [Lautropia sp.]
MAQDHDEGGLLPSAAAPGMTGMARLLVFGCVSRALGGAFALAGVFLRYGAVIDGLDAARSKKWQAGLNSAKAVTGSSVSF